MAVPLPAKVVPDPLSQLNFEKIENGVASEKQLKEIEEKGLPVSGAAGGVLKGTYPNPEFAADMATQIELDKEKEDRELADTLKADKSEVATDIELAAEKTEREAKDKTEKEAREAADTTEKSERETKDNERVVGPGVATDLDVAVYEGATGKKIKDGGKTVAQLLARANHTGTQTAATISDLAAVVKAYRLDEFAKPTSNLDINEKKIIKLADPTEALDAANKEYVDAAASAAAAGLSLKNPASYASTGNIAFTSETAKTLEGNAPLEIDGKLGFAAGTRILLKDQTTKKQNGIYEVTFDESFGGSGSFGGEGTFGSGSKWKLTRTADADTEAEVVQGMFVTVVNGTTNAGSAWVLQTENPIVIGTTNQEFTRFTASPTGTAGGDLTGTYPNPSIKDEVIVNKDVSPTAAIAYSKLNLAASILTGDFAASAKAPDAEKLDGIDSTGFLQLAVGATRKIAFGTTEITWPGGVKASTNLEVTHGLGTIPVAVVATAANSAVNMAVFTFTSTKFTTSGEHVQGENPGAGTKVVIYWIAIG